MSSRADSPRPESTSSPPVGKVSTSVLKRITECQGGSAGRLEPTPDPPDLPPRQSSESDDTNRSSFPPPHLIVEAGNAIPADLEVTDDDIRFRCCLPLFEKIYADPIHLQSG